MAGLTLPFDYAQYLIGEEILYRALSQQQRFAATGQYGMTWDQQDETEKSQAFFQANVLRADFTIPSKYQHCVPEPPCPWDKQNDQLTNSDFWPIITLNEGVFTYGFTVNQRQDSGNQFTIGPAIIQYTQDQGQLDPAIQGEFAYFGRDAGTGYTGLAIVQIVKQHRGTVQSTYYYLFEMI